MQPRPTLDEWRDRARRGLRDAFDTLHSVRDNHANDGMNAMQRARRHFVWTGNGAWFDRTAPQGAHYSPTELRELRVLAPAAAYAFTWARALIRAVIHALDRGAAERAMQRDGLTLRRTRALLAATSATHALASTPAAPRAPGAARLRMA